MYLVANLNFAFYTFDYIIIINIIFIMYILTIVVLKFSIELSIILVYYNIVNRDILINTVDILKIEIFFYFLILISFF
jgi:hypothetical protein